MSIPIWWQSTSLGLDNPRDFDPSMAPREMGEFVVRLADAFGLERPHLVGPDVGTAASLFAAANNPGRFRSLAIGTGGAAVPLQLGGVLKEWVEAPSLEPYREIDGAQIVTAAIATLEHYRLTTAARQDYLASYQGERFAELMRYVRAYPEQLPVLSGLLPTIETPVLIINGARDPCRTACQRHVPAREIAEQQVGNHRCWTFHLGRRCRFIWRAAYRLVAGGDRDAKSLGSAEQ